MSQPIDDNTLTVEFVMPWKILIFMVMKEDDGDNSEWKLLK